ncbi:two-component system sensor histidine kinase YesM [Neobacillus niacini]|uniref:sensor histidine kinase n=1 Tax=Neobacillus niacini TaxID=86668 RepID=UPI002856623C|nr:histidine kinase [Neobacillus niacini]MDR7078936.1 two-component system sensor histidine kinase YesM [Neobacillus niacini]
MKWMSHIIGSLPLRRRLIIASVICLLLPSMVNFLLSNKLIKNRLVQQAVNQSEDSLQTLNLDISKYFDEMLYLTNYIQFDTDINSILKQNLNKHRSTPELKALSTIEISRSLQGVTDFFNPFYLTILTDSEYYYTNYSSYEHNTELFFQEEWYKKMKDGNEYGTFWIGVQPTYIHSEKKKKPYLLSIARVLRLSETSNAVALISINETQISSLFKQIALDEGQELMLLNSDGVILAHNNTGQIQKKILFDEKSGSENDNASIVHYKNKDYLMVSYPFSYADWTLVSMVPYENAIGSVNQVTKNTLILQLIFFLLFLIILVILVKRLTKPVTRLSSVMKEVENGNLKLRSGMKGKGDIEQLGHSLDKMMDQIENMIEQIKKEENSKRKAELEMLQAQINPHFLFNMLNSLRLKILIDGNEEMAKLIQSLSLLLRMTINRNNEFIPLDKEIEVIEHYIKLMNFRGKYNFEIKKECESNTLVEQVPRFFLQPIIENSIIHGYKQKSGIILISTRMEDEYLLIQVKDNGKGFHPEDLMIFKSTLLTTKSTNKLNKNKSSFTGIGITNVYQRMLLIYGEKFHMEIENQPLGGAIITFYIPRNQEELENV